VPVREGGADLAERHRARVPVRGARAALVVHAVAEERSGVEAGFVDAVREAEVEPGEPLADARLAVGRARERDDEDPVGPALQELECVRGASARRSGGRRAGSGCLAHDVKDHTSRRGDLGGLAAQAERTAILDHAPAPRVMRVWQYADGIARRKDKVSHRARTRRRRKGSV